jgi:transposase-like protein
MTTHTTNSKKQHTPQFKAKLVLEAIEIDNNTEIARRYGVNHSLLAKRKKFFLENSYHVFESTSDKENREMQRKIGKLEQMIGRKEVELNLLKNFSDFYASRNSP